MKPVYIASMSLSKWPQATDFRSYHGLALSKQDTSRQGFWCVRCGFELDWDM